MHICVDAPWPYGRLTIACDEEILGITLQHHLPSTILQQCPLIRHSATRYTLHPHVLGGKGGFGSQLRTAGSRMKRKKHNNDAAKDASGRRIATLKQAKQLAEALRDLPEREALQREAKRAQLEKCIADAEGRAGRRIKFDDEDYLEVSESLLEGIGYALEEAYADDAASGDSETEVACVEEGSSSNKATTEPRLLRKLKGWDEGDEDDDDEEIVKIDARATDEPPPAKEEATEEDSQQRAETSKIKSKGKGKAPARARRK
ncbi:telomere stability and silencing-domain-containing protein [Protomyces lactucae-debilis]|uniref:Telomere stability and silencing-domain-containing protein n=1 Tax=Protomyces lactucae-debilis TaxID=2754530 RepID=A0A1Y2EXU1_PROLT|nr:telomere stability and silencing-domain-containing protein [Protomyces lactucae-debilis]ORY76307.1 telomere stability and silencing-domain-containing protein [Protomyces lactucae-debilis]